MREKVFNGEGMKLFLRDFDYIGLKYGLTPDNPLYARAAELEGRIFSVQIGNKSPSRIKESIELVYGESNKANDDIIVYRLVMNEIIRKYLHIPGIERLFDEHFFEMEWDMHSRMNFEKHEVSFYRDHFIHQVRNLYEMYVLLQDKEFYEHMENTLCNSGISEISYYVSSVVEQLVNTSKDRPTELSFFEEVMHSEADSDSKEQGKDKSGKDSEEKKNEWLTSYYSKYIIYASTFLSALFHDIGYPLEHFLNLRERISEYLPILYMFINGDSGGYDQIRSALNESLLFTIIPAREINESLFRKDHGTISAIAFLLQLYETGSIHSLSLEKRAAVEIAAVAIYAHTIKYYFVSPKEETAKTYYRTMFLKNPISYLLRLCDDLQEWDRVYFEIQNVSSLKICPVCKTPLSKKACKTPRLRDMEDDLTDWLMQNENLSWEYGCHCQKTVLFQEACFPVRKIISVCACKRMYMRIDEGVLEFHLDYNQYQLLQLLRINPTFAKYRIKELNYIKRLVWGQDFDKYQHFQISFSLSANPLILKRNMVGECVELIEKLADAYEIRQLKELKVRTCELYQKYTEETEVETTWEKFLYSSLKKEFDIGTVPQQGNTILSEMILLADKLKGYTSNLERIRKLDEIEDTTQCLKEAWNEYSAFEAEIENGIASIIECLMGGNSDVQEHIKFNLFFYIRMWVIQRISREASVFKDDIDMEIRKKEQTAEYKEYNKRIVKEFVDQSYERTWTGCSYDCDNNRDETMEVLLADLIEQTVKEQVYDKGKPSKCIEYYYDYMKSEDGLYIAVGKYCGEFYRRNLCQESGKRYYCLDYYTDLYFYHQLTVFHEILKTALTKKQKEESDFK